MNQVPQIKRFILKAVLAMGTTPMPDAALIDAVLHGVVPRPMKSDVVMVRDELQDLDFIIGTKDPVDDAISWTLTISGTLQAKRL